MSLVFVVELGRNFRDLRGVPAFQLSMVFGCSRDSPGALFLSEPTAGLSTSDDGCLYSGAELDGDVSPDALLWLIPLWMVSICH